jgi:hypothetical protein
MRIDLNSTNIKISSVGISQDISKKQESVCIPRKSLNIEKELTNERNETTNRRLIKTQRLCSSMASPEAIKKPMIQKSIPKTRHSENRILKVLYYLRIKKEIK